MSDDTESRDALQRAIAERASEFATDNHAKQPRRYWQYAIALTGALLIVALLFFGFDTFLASMQKVIAIMGADKVPTGPMPVFMVPEPPSQP